MKMDGSKKQELLNEAVQKITDYLKENKPYLFKVDELVQKTNNGVLNLSIKVYNGFVTDIVEGTEIKRYPFNKTNSQKSK